MHSLNRLLCLLLLVVGGGFADLAAETFTKRYGIPAAKGFHAAFGANKKAGDRLVVEVFADPDDCTITCELRNGSDAGWQLAGCTYTYKFPSETTNKNIRGEFGGTYSCPGEGDGGESKWTGSGEGSACELTYENKVAAPEGGSKTRLTVGVDEQTDLTSAKEATWTTSAGKINAGPSKTTTWTAPCVAAPQVTITATYDDGTTCTLAFEVIIPTGIAGAKVSDNFPPGIPPANTQGA
ncbi:MAG: hypothetical protein PF961_16675, partial [Planctomycetota bacterium]|nr:hypothetical protein [Planctomycetota bacterium]